MIHDARESPVKFLGFSLWRGEFIAFVVGVENFILGATFSDAGVPVAKLGRSANARYQLSIGHSVRRHLETSVFPVNGQLFFGNKVTLERWNYHLSSYLSPMW